MTKEREALDLLLCIETLRAKVVGQFSQVGFKEYQKNPTAAENLNCCLLDFMDELSGLSRSIIYETQPLEDSHRLFKRIIEEVYTTCPSLRPKEAQ